MYSFKGSDKVMNVKAGHYILSKYYIQGAVDAHKG